MKEILALGLKEDDLEAAAQHLYARSKAKAATEDHRRASERAMKERELADEVAATRKELKEFKEGATAREQQAAADAEVNAYLGRVARVASLDRIDAPLVKARLEANPKAARNALAVTAYRLAHERELQQLRRELGADAAPAGAAGKPATGPPVAKPGKGAKPALAIVDDDATGEVRHPSRDEMLRELRSGAT